jgi:hypothetical protein
MPTGGHDRSRLDGLPRKIQFIGGKKSNLSEIEDVAISNKSTQSTDSNFVVHLSARNAMFDAYPGAIERNDPVEPQGDYASPSRRIGLLARTII